VAHSVLNFGLPPLAGQRVARLDITQLERTIAEAIRRFEPRILPQTLSVRALETSSVLDTHNTIEFEIRGHRWAQPVPLELLLRTKLDLEAGQVEVRDASGTALQRAA
jgi:type VI secretion system protein ImpF